MVRRGAGHPDLEQRVAELEARLDQESIEQAELIDDLIERLDFAERLLLRQNRDAPRDLQEPRISTPV